MRRLRRPLLISLALGVLVALGLGLYADFPSLLEALAAFPIGYIPLILALTLFNYLLRFLKWEFYLGQLGIRGLKRGDSFAIFFSGLAMALTPAKVGEWVKSYLLREATRTPVARSAPIVLAERLTDGIAMALLALGGLVLFPWGWQVLVAVGVLAALFLGALWFRPAAAWALALTEKMPLGSAWVHHLRELYESARIILSPRNLLVGVSLGFVSWLGECLAFYFVLLGLGVAGGPLVLLEATFIFAISTIAGSLLMTPGGLGVAEGGLTGLSQLILGLTKEKAVAGALIIRLGTLWFGVALGIFTLILLSRRIVVKIEAPTGE